MFRTVLCKPTLTLAQGSRMKVYSSPLNVGAISNPFLFPAIRAVQDMVGAPDFDRKMLLLATQLANECNMKTLLLAVLEALLESVQNQNSQELHMEALTLIRCIIRLVVKLMAEPGADRYGAGPVADLPDHSDAQGGRNKCCSCSHLDRPLHHRCVAPSY